MTIQQVSNQISPQPPTPILGFLILHVGVIEVTDRLERFLRFFLKIKCSVVETDKIFRGYF